MAHPQLPRRQEYRVEALVQLNFDLEKDDSEPEFAKFLNDYRRRWARNIAEQGKVTRLPLSGA